MLDLVARYLRQQQDMFGEELILRSTAPEKQSNSSDTRSLDDFYEEIKNCQKCALAKTRQNFVFGAGNPDASLMLIGEAPGAEEDRQGIPFVGRAGQLLTKMLKAIDFDREEVYIGNILKCRPPGNRDPHPDEILACKPHLKEQIRIIKPDFILALGRIAGQALLNTPTALGKLRQQVFSLENAKALVTYHPAALLRFPQYKDKTWEDLQLLKKLYDETHG